MCKDFPVGEGGGLGLEDLWMDEIVVVRIWMIVKYLLEKEWGRRRGGPSWLIYFVCMERYIYMYV